ncbi:MAG: hypothetical protein ACO1OF_05095 [Adhaeribacter sp.]
MTAIIGVLNKTTVAIAADSAATVTSGTLEKVYNNANKIFNLCSNAPVAICIYNSAEFMGIPWETIIKMYRSDANTHSKDDLFDYGNHFIEYLKVKFLPKVTIEDEKRSLAEITLSLLAIIWRNFEGRIDPDSFVLDDAASRSDTFNEVTKMHIIPELSQQAEGLPVLAEFDGYDFEVFAPAYRDHIEEVILQYYKESAIEINAENTAEVFKLVFEVTRRNSLLENFTGLVFTGFGNDDILPKLNSFKVGAVIDRRIRFTKDVDQVVISNNQPSAIAPFAQTDMVDGFLLGLDPAIKAHIPFLIEQIAGELGAEYLKETVQSENFSVNFTKKFIEKLDNYCLNKNLLPIFSTLGNLSKEDLSEMAESLIYLTYLKRRVSFTQESVGGPVDVAIVTKGDGFVWIKRKHYFKPELNLNYLAAVFNQTT